MWNRSTQRKQRRNKTKSFFAIFVPFCLNHFPFNLHFCWNTLTLFPAFNQVGDLPGAAVAPRVAAHANISGNTLLAGGEGVRWYEQCTNALVLKNNFSGVTHRALAYDDSTNAVRNIRVLKNVLGRGHGYHLDLDPRDGHHFYFWKNVYTNSSGAGEPVLNPGSSPIHFIR